MGFGYKIMMRKDKAYYSSRFLRVNTFIKKTATNQIQRIYKTYEIMH